MYAQFKQAKEQAAQEWLEQYGDLIPDADPRDMAASEGYEVPMMDGDDSVGGQTLLDALTLEMARDELEAGFWEDSEVEDTAIMHGGIFNVAGSARWRGTREIVREDVWANGERKTFIQRRTGCIIQARYDRHKALCEKKRARFGLDGIVYDKAGDVRVARVQRAIKENDRAAVRNRKHAIKASMDKAEKVRILAEKSEARKARALKKLSRKAR